MVKDKILPSALKQNQNQLQLYLPFEVIKLSDAEWNTYVRRSKQYAQEMGETISAMIMKLIPQFMETLDKLDA
jgi:hypothetical protein